MIELVGGKVTETELVIPLQQPKPARLEQFSPGIPYKLLKVDDPVWQWKGGWTDERGGKTAKATFAEASFTFIGVGCMLVGELTQDGGRADVYVDGQESIRIDAYNPERTHDDALWHIYGLRSGEHTIKIVMRDDADVDSKGKKVVINHAVVYGAK